MKQREDYIDYNFAVSLYLKRELKKLNSFLEKKKLTHVERSLIKARLLNINGNTKEAIELLENITPSSYFLKAQKFNVLSSIYDKLSHYQKAAVSNQQAIINYTQLSDAKGLFISYLNLSINYSRLSLEELFEFAWKEAHKYTTNEDEIKSLTRAKVSYLSKQGKFKKALDLVRTITCNDGEYKNKFTYQNLEADILFRLKRFKESEAIYKELHKKAKSLTRHRVIYEHNVTQSLINKKNLKQAPVDFPRDSEYYYLWQTLLYLQDGEPQMANEVWVKLMGLNPDKYLSEFNYKDLGDINCHFSQYLDFIKEKNTEISINPFRLGSRSYELIEILRTSQIPLRKEVLIERLWDIPYCPTMDARFYKLIERTKKKSKVNISMRNSTYQIVKK